MTQNYLLNENQAKKIGVVTVTCLEKNGSVGPDNDFFFQPKLRYWLSLRFTSINFVFIKEDKIIDYL